MSTIKTLTLLIILILSSLSLSAQEFSKAASVEPLLIQKGSEKHWCPVCGMNLKMFYKTNHTSKLHNGTKRQYCSMRCLVVDMQEYGIDTNDIQVVDASTQKMIDAKKAYYVLGSKIDGTMSKVSKLAFALKSNAEAFVVKNSGEIVDFETALNAAKESLVSDTAMITKNKEKKIYPMGKNIFEKMCDQTIEPKDYIEINELKSAIENKKLCKALKEKELQALALYLWEVKRFENSDSSVGAIKVTKDEKCPICGMFVYKYPRWAAQIFYGDKHYSFDGVKDLMKYYFDHKENITKIAVSDYYTQKAIDATTAFYVVGSDIYGPMGNELIPFKNESDAKTFYIDHKGTQIVSFKDITQKEVYKLDE
jgi:nitrous oxide reductase accessory protein NosL